MKKIYSCLFFFLSTLFVAAQTCTPFVIFEENFGGEAQAPEQGPALASGTTSYEYTTAIPPEDGFYSIRKRTSGHPGTWHGMTDHTGNGGYMMVVNADYDPGKFYEKTITDLCQGTSFEFSAWVANLMRSGSAGDKDPDLRFVILNPNTDEIIGETTTGLLPRYATPTWEQYGISFDLPPHLDAVVLQIFNNAEGGAGNDLVLDDITFSICGPPMEMQTSSDHDICEGTPFDLSVAFPDGTGAINTPEFQWQFSDNGTNWGDIPSADLEELSIANSTPQDSGFYRMMMAEQGNMNLENCRITSDPISIRVWQHPSAPEIVGEELLCEGSPLILSTNNKTNLTFQWTGPAGWTSDEATVQISEAKPSQSGVYEVVATNPGSCLSPPAAQTVIVQENDIEIDFSSTDSILCQGEQIELEAFNPNATYLWNTGDTTSSLVVDSGGEYGVKVTKAACFLEDSIQVEERVPPQVHLGMDTTICYGTDYLLDATATDVENYLWQDRSKAPQFTVSEAGTYFVTLENECGIAMDQINIKTMPCNDRLIFPTAFSPNGDGQNDIFRPRVLFPLSGYRLIIYDRWGNQVFQSEDPAEGWDGQKNGISSPTGAYVWFVVYKKEDEGKIQQKGTVTLLK